MSRSEYMLLYILLAEKKAGDEGSRKLIIQLQPPELAEIYLEQTGLGSW